MGLLDGLNLRRNVEAGDTFVLGYDKNDQVDVTVIPLEKWIPAWRAWAVPHPYNHLDLEQSYMRRHAPVDMLQIRQPDWGTRMLAKGLKLAIVATKDLPPKFNEWGEISP